MNVYAITCLVLCDYNNVYSNPEKCVNAFLRGYGSEIRGVISYNDIIRKLKKDGRVNFDLNDYNGGIVSLEKIKVY